MSINLFTTPAQTSTGVYIPTSWRLFRDGVTSNVTALQDYYRQSNALASATHPLLRMLFTIQAAMTDDPYTTVDAVRENALTYASLQSITTSVSNGKAFNSVFYDSPVTEILIGHDDPFRIGEESERWEDIRAVQVLSHPKSDLYLQVLNGKPYSDQEGIAVIGINIPLLALQYWHYLHAPQHIVRDGNVQSFLGRYVIPNMLPSHVEIAWLNQMFLTYYGVPVDTYDISRTHALSMPNYQHMALGIVDQVLERLGKCSQRFDHLLQNIPSFYSKDMLQALAMPAVLETQQVQWALLAASNRYLSWLTDIVSGSNKQSANKTYASDLKQRIGMHACMAQYKQRLPSAYYFEQESYIANIYDKLLGQTL
jgi:hypothetical protein